MTASYAQFGGQADEPQVDWSVKVKTLENNEVDLVFTAVVPEGFHIYSPYQQGGPKAMFMEYEVTEGYKLVGKIREYPKPHTYFDDVIYETEVKENHGTVNYTQKIKITSDKPFTLEGEIVAQICKNLCYDSNFKFSVDLPAAEKEEVEEGTEEQNSEDTAVAVADTPTDEQAAGEENAELTADEEESEEGEGGSLWGFFFAAMILGVAGIFTPCVFPMIPMNIAFFLNYKGGKTKGKFMAIFYGLSIIFIYSGLGLIISAIFGPGALNNIVTHWLTNVIFFAIFVFFAASFFGAFELVLPSKWVNKADSQVDKGGLVGTFFMALTLVLVSFSCTAAFIGALLVEAADGSLLKPFIGMFGFSVGFGVPFALLALFPSLLEKMPQSGGWMNAVKVVFGFVIVGFGMKFLIVPDQTYHLGILTREVYLSVWIALSFLLGLYLLGKIKFSHDSDVKHIGFFRLILVIVTFSFMIYLTTGLFGAELKGLSSMLPPKSATTVSMNNGGGHAAAVDHEGLCSTPKHTDIFHFSNNLQGYFTWEEAVECAKEQNKPIFIDFTGHACSNCKVMEAQVWSDPRVLELFNKEFIMLGLYTDDRTKLPEDQWITNDDGEVLKRIGEQNKHFQVTKFGTTGTPLYVVVDHEGKALSGRWQIEKDIDGFVKFLEDGIENYKK